MSLVGTSADCYYDLCTRCIAPGCACSCHSIRSSVYDRRLVKKKILSLPKKVSDRPRGRPKKEQEEGTI